MNDLQNKLFETVRLRVKNPRRWIDEIADVLCKSRYAVYKKVQGESCLSLDELVTLATHYHLHLDPLIRPETVLSFEFPFHQPVTSAYEYLTHVRQHVEAAYKLPDVHIWHAGTELPFMHDHMAPDLVAFRFYIYQRTVWSHYSPGHSVFDLEETRRDSRFMQMLTDSLELYYQLPTTEIWNSMMLDITLSQIRYALQSGMFAHNDDAFSLCNSLEAFVNQMEQFASAGVKYRSNGKPGGTFDLYHNEIVHSTNLLLLKSTEGNVLYMGFANPQFIYAANGIALKQAQRWLEVLRQNATPITHESRKERTLFFASLMRKINNTRDELTALIRMYAVH